MSFCRILYTLCSQVIFHKVQRKIAVSGTKSKIPSTFSPALLKSAKQIVNKHSFSFNHQTDQGKDTEGFEREGLEGEG